MGDATDADPLEEFEWLINNSEGVQGLKLDGTVMPWREVLDLYLPNTRRSVEIDA